MALTDALQHLPPTAGTQDYNGTPFADLPLALNGSYVDSVFGETIVRATNIGANVLDTDIYAHHWANADGTMAFTERSSGLVIINTATCAVLYTGVPEGNRAIAGDTYWHPTDPDKYFFFSGTSLMRRNVAAQTNTTIRDFTVETGGANLGGLGGTADCIDNTGQYIVVHVGAFYRLYDMTNNILYTGNIPPAGGGGWGGITPSGKYVISAFPQTSYAVDHVGHTVNTTGVVFWNLAGDHSIPLSASDGKDYCIVFESTDTGAIHRADVTINVAGMTNAAQRAAQPQLLLLGFNGDNDGHFSAVGRGTNQDWAFWSAENQNHSGAESDIFNAVPPGATWKPYRSEICAINILTGVIRRLCHHRSRSVWAAYGYGPRVSCSWDGSLIIWASNMNDNSPVGTGDMFIMRNPLGAATLEIDDSAHEWCVREVQTNPLRISKW